MQNFQLQLRCFNAFKQIPTKAFNQIYQQLQGKRPTQQNIIAAIDSLNTVKPSLKNNAGFRQLQLIKANITSNQQSIDFMNIMKQYNAEQELLYQLDYPSKECNLQNSKNTSPSSKSHHNSQQKNTPDHQQFIPSKNSNISQYLYQTSFQNIDNQNLTLSSEINDDNGQTYDIGFLDEVENIQGQNNNIVVTPQDDQQLQTLKYSQLQKLREKRKQQRAHIQKNDFADMKSQTKIDTTLQLQSPSSQEIIKSGFSFREQTHIPINAENDKVMDMLDQIQANIENQTTIGTYQQLNANDTTMLQRLKEFESKNQMLLLGPQNADPIFTYEIETQYYYNQQMMYHELHCDLEMKKLHLREKLKALQTKLERNKTAKIQQILDIQRQIRPNKYTNQSNYRQLISYITPQFNKINVTFKLIQKRYQHLKKIITHKLHHHQAQELNRQIILQQLQASISQQ